MGRLQYDSALRLLRQAILGGAKRRSTTQWEWDISGDCESPIKREIFSRPAADISAAKKRRKALQEWKWGQEFHFLSGRPGYHKPRPKRPGGTEKYLTVGRNGDRGPILIEMHVRCRTCSRCRKVRSRMWYARAMTETLQAQRSWFGTVTLNPQTQFEMLTRARRKARQKGVIWEEMNEQEQFRALHQQNGVLLQLWLKRVRKESKAPLRFLLVAEAHKSGLPHYHCLVHETDAMRPVRHKTLSDQWPHGFTNFKLVTDPRQAGYLCKYLSKSALARVRASSRYGQLRPDVIVKRDATRGADTPPVSALPTLDTRSVAGVMLGASREGGLSEEAENALSEWDERLPSR